MAVLVYTLCALTAVLCAGLLLKAYAASRYRLLLWSGLCFVGLALNNVLLVFDKVVFPTSVDLQLWRSGTALVAMLILLYGLVMESD
jgi:hypothetical protein